MTTWSEFEGTGVLWLFQSSLRSGAVLALAVVASLFIRRTNPRLRHLLWSCALLGALAVPLLSGGLPTWKLALWSESSSPLASRITSSPPTKRVPEFTPLEREGRQIAPGDGAIRGVGAVPSDHPQPRPLRASPPPAPPVTAPRLTSIDADLPARAAKFEAAMTWKGWVLVLWLLGAGFVAMPLIVGLAGAARFTRHARPVRPGRSRGREWEILRSRLQVRLRLRGTLTLLQSNEIHTPMTWGFWHPVILVPQCADSWPLGRKRIVLLHELVHVKRRDWLLQILGHVACALYWFNPLVWIACRSLSNERERACDADVIAAGTPPTHYATQLLAAARAMAPRPVLSVATLGMANPSQLEGRLRSILANPCRGGRHPLSLTKAVMVLLTLALATVQPGNRSDAGTVPRSEPSETTLPSSEFPAIDPVEEDAIVAAILAEVPPTLRAAMTLWDEEQWPAAAVALDKITRHDPDHGPAWFRLGYARHMLGDFAGAIQANVRAARFLKIRDVATYNIACAYARLGVKDLAFAALKSAEQSGFDDLDKIRTDPDLESLRDDPRYQAFLDDFFPPKKSFLWRECRFP